MSSKKYLPGPESYREFRETGPCLPNWRPSEHGFSHELQQRSPFSTCGFCKKEFKVYGNNNALHLRK